MLESFLWCNGAMAQYSVLPPCKEEKFCRFCISIFQEEI